MNDVGEQSERTEPMAKTTASRTPPGERRWDHAASGYLRRFDPPQVKVSAQKGVLRIIAFFVLTAVLLWVLDLAITRGLRQIRTSDFGVSNRMVRGEINADIIVSGSSRALTHYDPRIIQQITGQTAFNLGRNGSQTDMQLAYLKTYLAHNRKPRLVVHNLDLFSFVTSREIYNPAQYLPYLDEAPIYAGISSIYSDAWKWKALPLYGYVVKDMRFTWITGLGALVGFQPREDLFNGFQPRHTAWTGEFDQYREKHAQGVRFEIEPEGIRDLTELVKICRDQGIPVVLVYSPEYSEMQALELNRDAIFARFKALADTYGATLWDYSHSPLSQDRSLFYNSQHLNAQGAQLFSTAFAQQLRDSNILLTKSTIVNDR